MCTCTLYVHCTVYTSYCTVLYCVLYCVCVWVCVHVHIVLYCTVYMLVCLRCTSESIPVRHLTHTCARAVLCVLQGVACNHMEYIHTHNVCHTARAPEHHTIVGTEAWDGRGALSCHTR